MRLGSGKKTLFITGGLGFIGSHFVDRCISEGHNVICYDKETYAANRDRRIHPDASEGQYVYVKGDISEIDSIPHCDVIVNFAAESHVDNSISGNDIFMRSNVLGVHRMLELLKNKKISNMLHSWAYEPPLFVQISTDETFGDIELGSFKEDDRHRPSNPYAATKSAAEQLVVAWGRTYGLPYIITRTTNNYGPRQHVEKLIPRTISNLLSGRKAVVHGGGSYIRNWIHVLDNVDALYRIIDVGGVNEMYHIASPEECSVRDIVARVCDRLNVDYASSIDQSTDRSGADVRYALDYSKTLGLGWVPVRTLNGSLDELISYYRARIET